MAPDYVMLLARQMSDIANVSGRRKGTPVLTDKLRQQLSAYWTEQIELALSAGVSALLDDDLEQFLRTAAAGPEIPDADYWRSLSLAAIALNVDKTTPTNWELFQEALHETLEEVADDIDDATEPARYVPWAVGLTTLALGAVALIARTKARKS